MSTSLRRPIAAPLLGLALALAACAGGPAEAPAPAGAPAPSSPAAAPPPPPAATCAAFAGAVVEPSLPVDALTASLDACLADGRGPELLAPLRARLRGPDAGARLATARVLTHLRVHGRPCEHDATISAIAALLMGGVAGDAALGARIAADPAFAPVASALPVRLALAGAPAGDDALRALVTGAELWAPPQGVFGSPERVVLEAGGAAVSTLRAVGDDGQLRESAGPARRWEVGGGALSIDGVPHALDAEGNLVPAGGAPGPVWLGAPPECAA